VKERKYNQVRLFLYSRINSTADNNQALMRACRHGDLPMVKILLANKRVSSFNHLARAADKCMMCAITWDYMDIFKYLLGNTVIRTDIHKDDIVFNGRHKMLDIIEKNSQTHQTLFDRAESQSGPKVRV
jgi:ankyrin repeat protein